MAKTLLPKLFTTIIPLFIFLLLTLHLNNVASYEDEENDDDEYVLDDSSILTNHAGVSTRSRFLTTSIKKTVKKGTKCDAKTNPYVCNGVWANKGTSLLRCCKKHCRNVLGDRNNCSKCGHKCKMGERCCGGVCTNVLRNKNNCGKCKKKCGKGVKCDYGYCGYA